MVAEAVFVHGNTVVCCFLSMETWLSETDGGNVGCVELTEVVTDVEVVLIWNRLGHSRCSVEMAT